MPEFPTNLNYSRTSFSSWWLLRKGVVPFNGNLSPGILFYMPRNGANHCFRMELFEFLSHWPPISICRTCRCEFLTTFGTFWLNTKINSRMPESTRTKLNHILGAEIGQRGFDATPIGAWLTRLSPIILSTVFDAKKRRLQQSPFGFHFS
jgi:hypothetical protein